MNGVHARQEPVLTACHQCDLLLQDRKRELLRKACCPRCGTVLHISSVNSMERTLALSLTGLLLFIPANTLPILTFELLGQSNTNTMINGIVQMAQGGYWWMSALVAFCSILAPLFKLLLLLFISAGSLWGSSRRSMAAALKGYHRLDEWGMFDVYMLGILIAFIKMKDIGGLVPGTGLFCFVGLLVVAMVCSSVFDPHQAWKCVGTDNDIGGDANDCLS